MMVPQHDIHSLVVVEWQTKATQGLNSKQQVQLLEQAIRVMQEHARKTLSQVTLMVIFDRVLHQTKKKFTILSTAKINAHTLAFLELHYLKDHDTDELIKALNSLLVELLRVLGRITADVLTTTLHKELLKVTWTEPEKI